MGFIVFLIIGGLVGWLASKIMGTDAQQGVLLNVIIGIVGAILAGWLISPLVGVGDIRQDPLSIGAILVSLVGAIAVIFIWKLIAGRGRTV